MPDLAAVRPGRGQRSPRGPLIGTFTFAAAVANSRGVNQEFGAGAGAWTVADEGAAAGFRVNGGRRSRLDVPLERPEPWFGLLPVAAVGGAAFGSGVPMPWVGGEIHNASGIGGAVVPVSALHRLSLRTYADRAPCQIRVFGGGTPIPADTVIELYALAL